MTNDRSRIYTSGRYDSARALYLADSNVSRDDAMEAMDVISGMVEQHAATSQAALRANSNRQRKNTAAARLTQASKRRRLRGAIAHVQGRSESFVHH